MSTTQATAQVPVPTQPPTQSTTTVPSEPIPSEPVPTSPPRPTLPITFGTITRSNINQIRKLNYSTLPVKYSTAFYCKLVMQYTELSRTVFYNDIMIGCYTVRVEDYEGVQAAYILTFVVLEPYRKFRIGTKMMEELERTVRSRGDVSCVYLHMHVRNEMGRGFYQNCGFRIEKRLDNYYTDLEEPHCYILRKDM